MLNKTQKAINVSDELEKLFGLPNRDKSGTVLDCLVETILSQNTNDVNRDRAFKTLTKEFPSWEEVLAADVNQIASVVRIAGLAGQKSHAIKNFLTWLHTKYGKLDLEFLRDMDSEEATQMLCQHKGIGIKTAYVTLAFACGHEVFPVDTHILRISKRIGFISSKATADQAHQFWSTTCPEGKAFSFHMNLIAFGRQVCDARKPKCEVCPLTDQCVYFQNGGQLP
ncbi:TPA: endonuclease III [Candidatus Poribacteria bacterium]|nr:endonuclease III [Candidatus Poribacteria bacterium]